MSVSELCQVGGEDGRITTVGITIAFLIMLVKTLLKT